MVYNLQRPGHRSLPLGAEQSLCDMVLLLVNFEGFTLFRIKAAKALLDDSHPSVRNPRLTGRKRGACGSSFTNSL